jgi:hypothetical protein
MLTLQQPQHRFRRHAGQHRRARGSVAALSAGGPDTLSNGRAGNIAAVIDACVHVARLVAASVSLRPADHDSTSRCGSKASAIARHSTATRDARRQTLVESMPSRPPAGPDHMPKGASPAYGEMAKSLGPGSLGAFSGLSSGHGLAGPCMLWLALPARAVPRLARRKPRARAIKAKSPPGGGL